MADEVEKMSDEQYWNEMLALTEERIGDLTEDIAGTLKDGVHRRWLQGLLETNKAWKLIAEFNVKQFEKYNHILQEVKLARVKTFRGNEG